MAPVQKQETYDKGYARRSLLIFAGFVITVMYIETMLVPSLPSIASQFNVNPAEVSLVLSMYLVSGVALSPIVGKLGDVYGKKRVLKYVMPIYVVAVASTGFSPNFAYLIFSRIVQGVGFTILPLAMTLVREQFPREKVPQAQGILSAMFGLGGAIGLPLGAFISNNFGWQTTYHTALPFVVLLTVLVFLFIKESRFSMPAAKIDYFGAMALAIGLGATVYALSEGTAFGWTSPAIASFLVIAVIFFALFAITERRSSKLGQSLLNFTMLKQRNVLGANVIALIVGMGFFLAYQTYAYEFESSAPLGYGLDIFHTGLALVPFAVMNIIVAPLVGRTLHKYGAKPYILSGAIVSIVGFLISAFSGTYWYLVAGAAIAGAGMAMLNVSLVNLLVLSVEGKHMGVATSTNVVFRIFGSSIGAPIAGVFIAEFNSRLAFSSSFYFAVATYVIVVLISVFVYEVLGKRANKAIVTM
ncbi:MAG: MFS transporter [Candidatus Micrarchaeota archaeon]|nr:MFS transporter [Candidatus Micrarchaeota archaeon]